MGCPNCALRVRDSLLQIDGVLDARVTLERGLAQVFDPATVQPDRLPAAVAAAGDDGRHRYLAQVLAWEGDPSLPLQTNEQAM
ncbi:MAG: heavy-metal-associated domain-containing protein [Chloroflexi bacterium]|nr:MAG: heavy-metal-associated domain-containing protein [Chloroflexota bacterium]